MLKPKPLTKEEREYIEQTGEPEHDESRFSVALQLAMRAEAYWREAVKRLPQWESQFGQAQDLCLFCRRKADSVGSDHAPTCPWKLAQDA